MKEKKLERKRNLRGKKMRRKREMEKLGNGMCLKKNFLPSNQLKPSERGTKIKKKRKRNQESGIEE